MMTTTEVICGYPNCTKVALLPVYGPFACIEHWDAFQKWRAENDI